MSNEEEGFNHDLYLFMAHNIVMTRVCRKVVVLSGTLTFILISTLIIGLTNSIDRASSASGTISGTQAALAQRINLSKVENDSTVTSGVKGTVFFTGADCPPTSAKKVRLAVVLIRSWLRYFQSV